MKTLTGFNENTKKHLLLDAGIFIKNWLPTETLEAAIAAKKVIGATQGGGAFVATPEIRQLEVDGVKGRVKGLEILDSWDVQLKANMLEVTEESLKMSLGAAATETKTGYVIITPKDEIEDGDYIDNITWAGTLSGSNKAVMIKVNNALNCDGLTLDTVDKSQTIVALNFYGHYDMDGEVMEKPFEIYYPSVEV